MTATFDRALVGLDVVDRNTVSGLIVPWGTDNEVVDPVGGGRVDHYVETWERGAFAAQDRSGNRGTIGKVALLDGHNDGSIGKVGYALELRDDDDGERGVFRVLPRHVDDVMQMIDDGIDSFSARFIPKPGGTRVAGMVGRLERRVRTAAHMVHVALVPEPGLAGAGVNREAILTLDEVRALEAASERTRRGDELLAEMETLRDRWANLYN